MGLVRFSRLPRRRTPVPLDERPFRSEAERKLALRIVRIAVAEVKRRYRLTTGQADLLKVIARGGTNEDAARERRVTVSSIKEIREALYERIGVKGADELIPVLLVAYQHALVRVVPSQLRVGGVHARTAREVARTLQADAELAS